MSGLIKHGKNLGDNYDGRSVALVLQVGAGQHGQCSAEAVSSDHQPVARVGRLGRVDLGLQRRSDGLVVIPESGVALTAGAERASLHGGLKVGEPVGESAATPEGQHDQLVGVVGGQVAGGITVRVGAGVVSA